MTPQTWPCKHCFLSNCPQCSNGKLLYPWDHALMPDVTVAPITTQEDVCTPSRHLVCKPRSPHNRMSAPVQFCGAVVNNMLLETFRRSSTWMPGTTGLMLTDTLSVASDMTSRSSLTSAEMPFCSESSCANVRKSGLSDQLGSDFCT